MFEIEVGLRNLKNKSKCRQLSVQNDGGWSCESFINA